MILTPSGQDFSQKRGGQAHDVPESYGPPGLFYGPHGSPKGYSRRGRDVASVQFALPILSYGPHGSPKHRSVPQRAADTPQCRNAKEKDVMHDEGDCDLQRRCVSKAALWLGPEPQQEKVDEEAVGKENTVPLDRSRQKRTIVLGYGPHGTPKAVARPNTVFIYGPNGSPNRRMRLQAGTPSPENAILSYGPHGSPKKQRWARRIALDRSGPSDGRAQRCDPQ